MNIKLNRGKCSKAGEVVSKTTWVSSILTVLANNTKSLFRRDSQSPTLNSNLPHTKCHRHTSPSDAGAIRKEYPKTNMDESKLHVIPNSEYSISKSEWIALAFMFGLLLLRIIHR